MFKDDSKNPLAIGIHVSFWLTRNVGQILSNSRWGTAALPLGLSLSQHMHTQSSHGYQHCFWPVFNPTPVHCTLGLGTEAQGRRLQNPWPNEQHCHPPFFTWGQGSLIKAKLLSSPMFSLDTGNLSSSPCCFEGKAIALKSLEFIRLQNWILAEQLSL